MGRGEAWYGRAGKVFKLDEPGRDGWGHRQFPAADRRGPRQDDQAVKTKLLRGSCLRNLDQCLGANASPLFKEPAARAAPQNGSAGSRVGWTSLPNMPNAAHFNGNTRSGR